jgi:PAS domain S-box-containing protein
MNLPTLRRKILTSMLAMVAVFGGFGVLMIIALSAAGSIPPALVHLNYDSIEAANQMQRSWNALRFPDYFPDLQAAEAVKLFDNALSLAESRVTEPGETETIAGIRQLWEKERLSPLGIDRADFTAMHRLLTTLVTLNETGMFMRVNSAKHLSYVVLALSAAVLLLTLIAALYLSDTYATRLSSPLKGIAEALHARPGLDKRLKLPTPTTLELRILIREIRRLWDSLQEVNKVNVSEIVQQKGRLETLLASVEDAFLVLDVNGVVTNCNRLMERLVGLPAMAIVGQPWADLSTASDNYLLLRDLIGQGSDQETEVQMTVDGRRLSFTLRCRPIRNPGGEAAGRLVLLRDITEKRLRERLRAELIDLLSHELKTPIQSLGMAAEMLAKHKNELDPTLQFFVETINEDVNRIRAVALQFVQATQAQAKILRLDLRHVPLSDQMRDWLKPFEVLADAKGVALTYEVASPGVVWANIDTVKFPWAVSNLLSNAIRVAPAGTKVGVRVVEDGGRAVVEVSDAGPGVPEAVQRRMYEPFYQGPADAAGGERGLLGVGLTIAKEVVEAHDGRLEYAPREPHGSTFRINLPATSLPAQPHPRKIGEI